jgi:hypothetical protein
MTTGQTYFPVKPLGPYSGPLGTAPGATPSVPGTPMPSGPGMPTGGQMGGGRMEHGFGADTAISTLPQMRQDRMTQLWGTFGGGQPMPATIGAFADARPISSLPQPRQDRMTQGWQTFGGGAAMPATLGAFRDARQTYYQAHPDLRPHFGRGGHGRNHQQRLADILSQG